MGDGNCQVMAIVVLDVLWYFEKGLNIDINISDGVLFSGQKLKAMQALWTGRCGYI